MRTGMGRYMAPSSCTSGACVPSRKRHMSPKWRLIEAHGRHHMPVWATPPRVSGATLTDLGRHVDEAWAPQQAVGAPHTEEWGIPYPAMWRFKPGNTAPLRLDVSPQPP